LISIKQEKEKTSRQDQLCYHFPFLSSTARDYTVPISPHHQPQHLNCSPDGMAPRKPTTATATATATSRKAASAKRTRDSNATPSDGPGKRQKTSATTARLIQDQAAGLPRRQSARASQQQTTSALPTLNHRPTQPLNIYSLGANSGGELGLGPSVKSGTIGKPRLNPYLSGSVGVVQVSLGAMHGAALTLDNKVLTWGVNDHGALGRDTSWEAKFVDADGGDSDSDDGGELNPKESTPAPADMTAVPSDTIFTQVAATDNATFALTSTGRVYGWGTFRVGHQPLLWPSSACHLLTYLPVRGW
jgi:regulator of chromosome condensation